MIRPRGDERAVRRDIAWVAAACAVSVALGLAFVFIRAPHPWGWQGFDHYDDLGRALARGERYPTLDRLWGYPLFLSVCYRAFGDRAWPMLVLQVLLNGVIPALVYASIRRQVNRRVAIIAALLNGACSFNTVYASTQSSDALCTVFTVAGVALIARAANGGGQLMGASGGLLFGCAAQLRPNMLLLPRSEEHTSELQSPYDLVCRLLLEKKKSWIIDASFKSFLRLCVIHASALAFTSI